MAPAPPSDRKRLTCFAIDQTAYFSEKALDLHQTVIDFDFVGDPAREAGNLFATAGEELAPARAAGFAANQD